MEVSFLSTVNNNYINDKKINTKEVSETELSETEKLEAFKKEIWDEINSMPWSSSINWSIQITDSAFERMMEEPEFKEKIMSVLAEDAAVGRYPMSNAMITVDENGYSGYSYNFGYGEEAFEAHSNDKDSFYTKKATKKIDYEELWEEQQLKREQQERLNKEYFDTLVEKRKYNQKQTVANLYEKGTVVLIMNV